ncbi:MAG: putative permease [Schlesneria sp.]|nr:putative permease [Schlesneria sp.]
MRLTMTDFSSFRPRPAGNWRHVLSCLVCISVLSIVVMDLFAAPNEPAAAKKPPGRALKIVSIEGGKPKLTVTDGDNQQVLKLAANAKVLLNGAPATVDDILLGDSVAVEVDDQGRITSVDATRLETGIVLNVDQGHVDITTDYTDKQQFQLTDDAQVFLNGNLVKVVDLRRGDHAQISPNPDGQARKIDVTRHSLVAEFWDNFRHNLFKPLLLFFYMGFAVPLLKIDFEFPRVMYQGLTIYLLISIGWHGGEELAELSGGMLREALMFMIVGFITNFLIGILAYGILRKFIAKMRRIDAATVAAYYGSDSAGTFVTCLGVLATSGIKYAPYMPVMLAIMEIPGCLVGLWLASRLRRTGMDGSGNMPDEPGFNRATGSLLAAEVDIADGHEPKTAQQKAIDREARMALENKEEPDENSVSHKPAGAFNVELLREVFLNPGLFLLFGGILIGFASRLQGHKVTDADDSLFVTLFQGLLCLFLLEMGMAASRRLMDLKTAGWRFILFGLLAPNIFATAGICIAHAFAMVTGSPLQLGTYALFAVLCAAASYIAVPAIQRLAIPEASPTLPLAASLGLTFSYNVTIGIPIYIIIAQIVIMAFPVG